MKYCPHLDGPCHEEDYDFNMVRIGVKFLMTFEHRENGEFVKYITVEDVSEDAAISKLSEHYKGVFRRVPLKEMHEPMKARLVGEL